MSTWLLGVIFHSGAMKMFPLPKWMSQIEKKKSIFFYFINNSESEAICLSLREMKSVISTALCK